MVMGLCKATLLFGTKDADTADVPFIWASLLSTEPKDDKGKPVKNPGNVMIYGARGISAYDVETVVLKPRGIDGLYDMIPVAKQEQVLAGLGVEISALPEMTVVEATVNTRKITRAEAREKSSKHRQSRRAAAAASSLPATIAEELTAQPE